MTFQTPLNDSAYVRSKDAAPKVGLTADYVSRLCREGSVDGKLLAGTWYVSEHSLKNFLDRQAREKAKRVEENAAALREERRRAEARAANLLASVPMHAPSIRGHMEAHALPPVFEFLQKLFAVIVAVLFTVGTYLFVDAQYARIAERSTGLSASLVSEAREQFAAAAENPFGTLANGVKNFAKALNTRVDSFVYDIMFPRALVEGSSGKPVARVVPSAVPRATDAPQPPSQTIVNQRASPSASQEPVRVMERVYIEPVERVIERVLETQRIVSSAGGLTEEILNARLSELDNKLSSQIYAVASVGSANSTQIVNNYNAVGGALRIDQLDTIDVNDSTWNRGTIRNAMITGATISGSTITGTSTLSSLAVTGTATSTFGGGIEATALNITSSAATSTFAHGIALSGGCVTVNGTCLGTGSGGSGTPGGSDTQVQFNNNGSFAGNANFTFSSSTSLLKVTNASSTLLSLFDRLYVGGSATTTIRGDGVASTLPYASSTALSVSGTGYFGSASTTNLTVSGIQNSILSTNATGVTQAATIGNGLTFSSNTLSTSFGTTTANTWTALQQFAAGASTTRLSVFDRAYFGGSATSTFDSAGNLSVVGTTNVSGLSTFAGFLSTASSTIISGLFSMNGGASTTNITASGTGYFGSASTTNLTISGTQNGILATNATGIVAATTTPTADYFIASSDTASRFPFASSTALTVSGTGYFTVASTTNLTVSGIQSSLLFAGQSGSVSGTTTLSVPFGGTGSTTLTGLLKGNGTGGILSAVAGADYVAAVTGDWTGTFDGLEGSSYLANSFSTTSASYFLSQNRGASFSTTSADYWVTASTTIPKTTLAINWTALHTFQSGLLSQASSTFTGFTQLAQASTTMLTNTANTYLTALTSALLGTDATGKVVSTTTIGANLLSGTITNSQLANSSVTVNSAGLLTGGGSVSLGGSLNLNASTSPTVGYVFATSTLASTLPYASSTALTVSGNAYLTALTSALLGTDNTGKLVSTSTIGANLIGGTLTDSQISSASVWHAKLASSSLQTSSLLAGLLSDETGTGNVVFSASPTLTGTANLSSLIALASSTIGAGTQAGGLTISGGATTTGYLVVQGTGTSTFSGGIQSTALNITSTSATSTGANGWNLTAGCFAVNGTCVGGGSTSFANPSASIGLTAVNGSASTAMRSDATPALSQAIAPTWTGLHQFTGGASSTLLSVYNNAYFGATATSSFSSAGVLTLGTDLAVTEGGTGASTLTGLLQGNGTSAITGITGTVGQFPYYNGTNTLLATSSIYLATSGNVGIGTAAPAYTLDVNGDVNVAAGKCFRVNGVCIGYIEHLAAIYATSTVGTTTVQFGIGGPTFSNATLTLPATTTRVVVEVWGAGGGGGGSATSGASSGGTGGTTCLSSNAIACSSPLLSATGGGGGAIGDGNGGGTGGAGGAGSGGDINETGGAGNGGLTGSGVAGGSTGGSAPRGGAGGGTGKNSTAGGNGQNFGGGGAGGGSVPNAVGAAGGGGGGGGYAQKLISNPSGTYTFTVGAGGSAGAGSSSNGGAGGTGGTVITIYATSSPTAAGNDYAEMFPVSSPDINAGDIVAVDTGVPASMRLATAGDTTLAGVISTQPGQTLGDQNAAGMRPVALSGRVPVKVSLENGPIKIGDRIAPSSVPGVGKKAGPFDNSVGTVIDNVQPDGTVMIFLDLHQGIDINALGNALLSPANHNQATSTPSLDATTTASTTSSYSYANNFLKALFARIIQWLADASNGITNFFAKVGHFDQVHAAAELCVGSPPNETCVNQQQLAALLSAAANENPPTSVPSTPSNIRDAEPPISVSSSTPDLMNSEDEAHENPTTTPAELQPEADAPPPTDQAQSANESVQETVDDPHAAPEPANDNPASAEQVASE